MDMTLFRHLLPCFEGDNTEGSFLPNKLSQVFMTPLDFFNHLADAQLNGQQTTCEEKVDVYTDDTDKMSIIEAMGSNDKASVDDCRLVTKDDVAAWYLKRAINLYKETGQIAHFTNACEMGLIRLGLISLKDIDISLLAMNEFCGKLVYMHLASHLLGHVSKDELRALFSLPGSPTERLASARNLFRSLLQFCSSGYR